MNFFLFATRSVFFRIRKTAMVLSLLLISFSGAVLFLNLRFSLEEGIARSLEIFGANLIIRESPSSKVRLTSNVLKSFEGLFWKNNILALAPILREEVELDGRPVRAELTLFNGKMGVTSTGLLDVYPQWRLEGEVPHRRNGIITAMVGKGLADEEGLSVGDRFTLGRGNSIQNVRVSGILDTFGKRNMSLFLPMDPASSMARLDTIELRALTTKEDSVYKRLSVSPSELPKADFEKWFCTPFLSSITYNLQNTFKEFWVFPVRPSVLTEDRLFSRVLRLCGIALFLSILFAFVAMWSTLSVHLAAQKSQYALFFVLGSDPWKQYSLVFVELLILLLPILLLGVLLGTGISTLVARGLFDVGILWSWQLATVILTLSLLVMLGMSLLQLVWQRRSISRGALIESQAGVQG